MKPIARALLFTLGEKSYAWLVTATEDDWRYEPIVCAGVKGSPAWAEAAFVACVHAFRQLQAAHPDMDMIISTEKAPIGHALPDAFLGRPT